MRPAFSRYSVTMRDPGASDVLMCGFTRRPAFTAFLASRPAASMTLGFDVLVQLVIAAISTSPLPMVTSRTVRSGGWASECADASVGLLDSISVSETSAADNTGENAGDKGNDETPESELTRWRVSSVCAALLNPLSDADFE